MGGPRVFIRTIYKHARASILNRLTNEKGSAWSTVCGGTTDFIGGLSTSASPVLIQIGHSQVTSASLSMFRIVRPRRRHHAQAKSGCGWRNKQLAWVPLNGISKPE